LAAKPGQVEQYQAADEAKRKKLLGGFMGPIMQASKGKANPQQVNRILQQKLNSQNR
jgi:aspartyl-tRNA(Asn)/glutamyl-tRNA(Gln) amidotransferase subunit B